MRRPAAVPLASIFGPFAGGAGRKEQGGLQSHAACSNPTCPSPPVGCGGHRAASRSWSPEGRSTVFATCKRSDWRTLALFGPDASRLARAAGPRSPEHRWEGARFSPGVCCRPHLVAGFAGVSSFPGAPGGGWSSPPSVGVGGGTLPPSGASLSRPEPGGRGGAPVLPLEVCVFQRTQQNK